MNARLTGFFVYISKIIGNKLNKSSCIYQSILYICRVIIKTIREMEVQRLNTGTLKATEYNYTFHDVSIVFDNDKQIIVEGYAEIDFEEKGSYIAHPFGYEPEVEFEITACDVNIEKVYNSEDEEINLELEEMQLVQNEIELVLRSEIIEKN